MHQLLETLYDVYEKGHENIPAEARNKDFLEEINALWSSPDDGQSNRHSKHRIEFKFTR